MDDRNNEGFSSSFEASGFGSFLAPGHANNNSVKEVQLPVSPGDGEEAPTVLKANYGRMDTGGPSYKDQVLEGVVVSDDVATAARKEQVSLDHHSTCKTLQDKNTTEGPSYKDQLREAYHHSNTPSHHPLAPYNTNHPVFHPPPEAEVQMVNAALVPQEDVWLAEKAQENNERRGKKLMIGLYATILLNVLLVGGALLALFCRGNCRRRWSTNQQNDKSTIPSCERAMIINLVSTKRRIMGTLQTAVSHQASCDTDPNIPGNWYRVEGTGMPLLADTCSVMTKADTTIAIYRADDDVSSSSAACSNLTCIETNDDFPGCVHGEEFSHVGWFGEVNTTYYIRVSGYDEQSLGSYSLAIDEFNDRRQQPCEVYTEIECHSNGTDCNSANPSISFRYTLCTAEVKTLQFRYEYATCESVMSLQPWGGKCDEFAAFATIDSALQNITLDCFHSTNSSETFIFNTSPWSVSPGQVVTLRSLLNDPIRGIVECDIRTVDTSDRLQHLTLDFNQTTPSLGDAYGSLKVVGCDGLTCISNLSFETYIANDGNEPLQISQSQFQVFLDNNIVVDNVDSGGSTVLNPGDATTNRTVIDAVNTCESDGLSIRYFVEGKTSGGVSCQSDLFYGVPTMLSPSPPSLPAPPVGPPTVEGPPPVIAGTFVPVSAILYPTSSAPVGQPTSGPPTVRPPISPPVPSTPTVFNPPIYDNNDVDDDASSSPLISSRWVRSLIAVVSLVYLFLVAGCAYRIYRRCKQHQEQELLEILKQKQRALEKNQNNQETKVDDDDHDENNNEEESPS